MRKYCKKFRNMWCSCWFIEKQGVPYITTLIVPKQESTSDLCQTLNEEEIFEVQDKYSFFPLGWIHIVNNIGEAPFLVHIYSDDEDDDDDKSKECSSSKKGMRLVKEKADADSWPTIKGRWDGGISPIPNGVILVEELKPKQVSDKLFDDDDDDDDDDDETKGIDNNNNSNSQLQYSTTKIWVC
ncbi:hypothetical protein ACSBR1_034059 [Camellia fascicularis]